MGVPWPIWCLSKNTSLRANGGACNSSARGDVTRMGVCWVRRRDHHAMQLLEVVGFESTDWIGAMYQLLQ
jgi:hypothetical protein